MGRNIHEIKKNLTEYKDSIKQWESALNDSTTCFEVRYKVQEHIRRLQVRIKNLEYLLGLER